MRVIAGEARRVPLVCPPGKDTRPTTDRIKETLFNMIQEDIPGSEFLDLFSGSGAIGIEAISRGAKRATFIEMAQEPVACIKSNLEKTKLVSRSRLLPMEVTYGIRKLDSERIVFDIVFMDPPYNKDWEPKILGLLSKTSLLHKDSLVIMETSAGASMDFIDENQFHIEKIKDYKSNRHIFLRVKEVRGLCSDTDTK